MKKTLLFGVLATSLAASQAFAIIASDDASNYNGPGEPAWASNGANGGTGFGGWGFAVTPGSGSAGTFIGDPSAAGISGMSSNSWGFYANPIGSGANIDASRGFSQALQDGETFSFQWGLNYDSFNASSNRGFNLKSGGSQLLNINMGDSATIRINGNNMFTNYGSQAFVLNFQQVSASSIRVYGTGRNGSESYDNTFTGLAGRADNFQFYFNATESGVDQRQMYLNNLSIVPEPATLGLLGMGAGLIMFRLARRRA